MLKISVFFFPSYFLLLIDTLIYGEDIDIKTQFKKHGIDDVYIPYPQKYLKVIYRHFEVNPEKGIYINLKDVASAPSIEFPETKEQFKAIILIEYYKLMGRSYQHLLWMVVNITSNNNVDSGDVMFSYAPPNIEGRFYIFLAYGLNKPIHRNEISFGRKTYVHKIQLEIGKDRSYAGNILYVKKIIPEDESSESHNNIEEQFKRFGIQNSTVPYPREYLKVIYPNYKVKPEAAFICLNDVKYSPKVNFPSGEKKYKIVILIGYKIIKELPYAEEFLLWMVVNIASDNDIDSGETIFDYKPPTKEEHFYIFLAYDTDKMDYNDAIRSTYYATNTSIKEIQSILGVDKPYAGNFFFAEKFISGGTMFTTSVAVNVFIIIICHMFMGIIGIY